MKSSIVLASSLNDCIGVDNKLPWSLPDDLKRFKSITTSGEHNIIIMGRKTYESIGKPLPGRINYVLTKDKNLSKTIIPSVFHSMEEAIADILWWEEFLGIEYNVFFIGGASVFQEAIDKNYADIIYHTLVNIDINGDTFFKIPNWKLVENEVMEQMSFRKFTRI